MSAKEAADDFEANCLTLHSAERKYQVFVETALGTKIEIYVCKYCLKCLIREFQMANLPIHNYSNN